MEDNDSPNFCTNCGAPLRDSDTFCNSCGAAKNAGAARTPSSAQRYPEQKGNKLMVFGLLSAIWAIAAIGLGLNYILSADAIASELDSYEGIWEALYDAGITYDTIVGWITIIGAVLVSSGVFAAVTALLCLIKRAYTVALIACILSSVLGLVVLLGAIGFVVAYFLSKEKNNFIDNASKT
ncbi:MAG: zinc ribbon domain-containing protein [Methanomassiliicoccaceae archaeon]|nr:zinc ribbon domain-containing protein [Methanomassiliicoccaceae archaeon]